MPIAYNGREIPAYARTIAKYIIIATEDMDVVYDVLGREHHNAVTEDRAGVNSLIRQEYTIEVERQAGRKRFYRWRWEKSATPPHKTALGLGKSAEESEAARKWVQRELEERGMTDAARRLS